MAQRGGAAKITTDHDFIRRWVEQRGGCPAAVKRTSRAGDAGIIRIDYPGYSGQQSLRKISWDEFFQKFDDNELAFLYQEDTARGQQSRFSKLVKRTVARERAGARQAGARGGRQARAGTARRPGNGATARQERQTTRTRQAAATKSRTGTRRAGRSASATKRAAATRTTKRRSSSR